MFLDLENKVTTSVCTTTEALQNDTAIWLPFDCSDLQKLTILDKSNWDSNAVLINQSMNQSINFIYPRIYSVALKC